MDQHEIIQLILHPERLDRATLFSLRALLARYPYFQTARMLYLKNLFLLRDPDFTAEFARAAAYTAERGSLFRMAEGSRYEIKPAPAVESEEEEGDRTMTLIDAFLTETDEQVYEPRHEIIPDYFATTSALGSLKAPAADVDDKGAGDESDVSEQDVIINRFLEGRKSDEPHENGNLSEGREPEGPDRELVEESEKLDESYFTETLAQIYVKQGRYSKALQIIKKLNLKFPKKNAYFADQIRFLEKLIINNKTK